MMPSAKSPPAPASAEADLSGGAADLDVASLNEMSNDIDDVCAGVSVCTFQYPYELTEYDGGNLDHVSALSIVAASIACSSASQESNSGQEHWYLLQLSLVVGGFDCVLHLL